MGARFWLWCYEKPQRRRPPLMSWAGQLKGLEHDVWGGLERQGGSGLNSVSGLPEPWAGVVKDSLSNSFSAFGDIRHSGRGPEMVNYCRNLSHIGTDYNNSGEMPHGSAWLPAPSAYHSRSAMHHVGDSFQIPVSWSRWRIHPVTRCLPEPPELE